MRQKKQTISQQTGPVQLLPTRTISFVRNLKAGQLFEVCEERFRLVHANDCRAFVRPAGKRHVKLGDGTEFDTPSGGINISPNTEVFVIDEAEELI